MLIDLNNKNNGKDIFTEICNIDWYDGGVTGTLKLASSTHWYLFNLCFFDPGKSVRIFTLIEVRESLVRAIESLLGPNDGAPSGNYFEIKNKMQNAFDTHTGDVFLLKAASIAEPPYEIVKIPLSSLNYFHDIEDTFEQSEESITSLKSHFQVEDV